MIDINRDLHKHYSFIQKGDNYKVKVNYRGVMLHYNFCDAYTYNKEILYIYTAIINNVPISYITERLFSYITTSTYTQYNIIVIPKPIKTYKVPKYSYFPKNTKELELIITKLIELRGDECSLNDIDTSKITNMNSLFYKTTFNGDISKWNVSNVDNMRIMFNNSEFNGDISKWDVSSLLYTHGMFANSKLEKIPKWA